jgi:beta-mannosidase
MIKYLLHEGWQFQQAGTAEWLPASVPGGVHTDLLEAGRIPDPFLADNEERVQWVAEADWIYRCRFKIPKEMLTQERVELVCDGLDTLAEVDLNGNRLGRAENAFRQYRWQVKELLRPGRNELQVKFASPTRTCAERQQVRPLLAPRDALPGAPHLRKPPCQFGWDWGPRLPAVGIWRPIRLEGSATARLEEVHIRQQHQNDRVAVLVRVQAEARGSAPLRASFSLTAQDGRVSQAEALLDAGRGETRLAVEDPQLWWPNGYGRQPLYRLEVVLRTGGEELDRQEFQVGLRSLELRQQADAWGRCFTFVVNGVPIFAKGANWIPADSFPTRLTAGRLEQLVHSAALANQNMLRVWGGGFYEQEAFFDLCDRYGILVWQDFIFACSVYPFDDPQFVENVHQEVINNVRRLRHRACLALWCGNNEMEAGWTGWGWSRPETAGLKEADRKFFYQTLPAWLKQEDPDHPYWPSSPSSGLPHEVPDSEHTGDRHLWEVWHGNQPLRFYRSQAPRFASEFGFQSLPALPTVAAYAESADWNMTSYIMEYHQRNRAGNGKIISYLSDHYRMPKDFAALVYTSQVLQAEAMRIAVEAWRRNRARCSGTLYWQLNDCWPVASWSSLDYYGRWKALQYAARRFYSPVLLSIEDEEKRMGIFLTNDQVESWQGELRWSLEELSGKVLDSGLQGVSAAPLATTQLQQFDFSRQVDSQNVRRTVLVAELWQPQACLARSVAPFVPDKHLELADPKLEIKVGRNGGMAEITLQAGSLARFVQLTLDGADVLFSDNYFDLPAGRRITLICPLPEGWDARHFQDALGVFSLRDSY